MAGRWSVSLFVMMVSFVSVMGNDFQNAKTSEEVAGKAAEGDPASPELKFVMDLNVKIGEAFSVGETPRGRRVVIPITGGGFHGPGIKGEILPGGADYQLVNDTTGRTELEAIYCIRTDDGCNIHVRNRGVTVNRKGEYYFITTPVFEAPSDGNYAWLNDAVFTCRPVAFNPGEIILRVWKII